MGIECCGYLADDDFEDELHHNTSLTEIDKQKKALEQVAGVQEFGGQEGPEPTRFGDWEFKGRVSDF